MPTFLQRLMANPANTTLIEALRHAKKRTPRKSVTPAVQVLCSGTGWSAQKMAGYQAQLEANTVGATQIKLRSGHRDTLEAEILIEAPDEEIDEAITFIRKNISAQRVRSEEAKPSSKSDPETLRLTPLASFG